MNTHKIALFTLVFSLFLSFSACNEDGSGNAGLSGSTTIAITDAPVDDANISGVFVTITDIQLDGQSLEGFSTTTLDVAALQNGNTQALGNFELDARSYSNITLELDYENDATGNSPGCYVATSDGIRHQLTNSGREITFAANQTVEANSNNSWVIDFDLRKSITRSETTNDNYDFVTSAELNNALRLVNRAESSEINGNCDDTFSNSDKIIVYAYAKGSFQRDQEIQASGSSGVEFSNAVTSAEVSGSGDFSLHFLESGEYELHFAAYEQLPASNEYRLSGTLEVNALTNLDLNTINISSSTDITANVVVTGLLPIL